MNKRHIFLIIVLIFLLAIGGFYRYLQVTPPTQTAIDEQRSEASLTELEQVDIINFVQAWESNFVVAEIQAALNDTIKQYYPASEEEQRVAYAAWLKLPNAY